jgi:hypothetical protein
MQIKGQKYRHIHRRTDRHAKVNRQTYEKVKDIYKGERTDRKKYTKVSRQKYRHIQRRTDRKTDEYKGEQKERQMYT